MNARDELAEEITKMLDGVHGFIAWTDQAPLDLVDVILAAGYSKPRTITTVEELDALPVGSMVREDDGFSRYKYATGRWILCVPDASVQETSHKLVLPATVLHEAAA